MIMVAAIAAVRTKHDAGGGGGQMRIPEEVEDTYCRESRLARRDGRSRPKGYG